MQKATIQLETLTCPSCMQKIENGVKSLDGVDKKSIKALFNSSKVRVEYDDEKVSIKDIENGNYKITIGFSTGPNSINLPWSTGVRIATIQGICRPSVEYNGYNGQVYYKVMTNGDIIVRSHNGVYPNNTTYNYLLYYPFN